MGTEQDFHLARSKQRAIEAGRYSDLSFSKFKKNYDILKTRQDVIYLESLDKRISPPLEILIYSARVMVSDGYHHEDIHSILLLLTNIEVFRQRAVREAREVLDIDERLRNDTEHRTAGVIPLEKRDRAAIKSQLERKTRPAFRAMLNGFAQLDIHECIKSLYNCGDEEKEHYQVQLNRRLKQYFSRYLGEEVPKDPENDLPLAEMFDSLYNVGIDEAEQKELGMKAKLSVNEVVLASEFQENPVSFCQEYKIPQEEATFESILVQSKFS
ncbi:hypothetical protein ABKN59_002861 [Abortiporus biennis]